MPDISMCLGKDCPIKLECYRYMAKASNYQSYSDFRYNKVSGKCYYFMEIVNVAGKNDGRLRNENI
jgi:hypothetical protein